VTDHDNPDDASDSSAIEPSSLKPPTVQPSVGATRRPALAGAITGALGVILAALPILVMLWVWLAI